METYESNAPVDDDELDQSGMGPNSLGGYAPVPVIQQEKVEPEEVEGEQEEAGEEEEEEPETEYLLNYQQAQEQERLAKMDASTRSVYTKGKRMLQQQKEAEYRTALGMDIGEVAHVLREFPLVAQAIAGDFSFGRAGITLSKKEMKTVESPPMEYVTRWIGKNQKTVFHLLERESHPERSIYDRYKKLVNTVKEAPPISRSRDFEEGYNEKQERRSDQEVDELVDSLAEE